MKISFEVKGVDKVSRNIDTLISKIPTILQEVTSSEIQKLDQLAMRNLYSTTTSGPPTADSIDKMVRIEGNFTSAYSYKAELEYYSRHALVVEYGGAGEVMHAEDYGHKLWPIGKSQYGTGITFSPTYKLQAGKQFLTRAVFERTEGYSSKGVGLIGRAYQWRILSEIVSIRG